MQRRPRLQRLQQVSALPPRRFREPQSAARILRTCHSPPEEWSLLAELASLAATWLIVSWLMEQ
jgi:hypothetical protein